jgi:Ser/Thr protein kinase RdoA (MazF antagonist)
MQVEEAVKQRAAQLFGVNPAAMQSLGGMDGAVYAAQRALRPIVIKIQPLPEDDCGEALIKARAIVAFADYMAEGGVPVARRELSESGRKLEQLSYDGRIYLATASERAPGHHVRARFMNEWNEGLFERWGRAMGRMHALTQRFHPEGEPLPIQDWRTEIAFFLHWCDDPPVQARWREMRLTLEELPRPKDAYGLIHNDLHPHNFLVQGETLTIIDFDVCAYHWFATDIGIALFHALWMRLPTRMETPTEFALRFLRHLMRGYRAEHTLGTEWLLRLPTFVDYRRLLMHTVFSHEWGPSPAPRQDKMLQTWRTGILRGRPTIPLEPADLLTV